MKINQTEFKDYYDKMLWLSSSHTYYDRTSKAYAVQNSDLDAYHAGWKFQLYKALGYTWGGPVSVAVLGFCGCIYPVYYCILHVRDRSYLKMSVFAEAVQEELIRKTQFRYQDKIRAVKPIKPVGHLQHFLSVDSPIFLYQPPADVPIRQGLFNRAYWYFKACEDSTLYNITTVTNVCLADLDFDRLVDPVQAYQQLELFLNNTLVKPVEIQEPDDKLKRDMHGFDALSFKQTSPGKKAKRKKYA